jgi:long-chain acyl-CoA synthetase
VGIVEKIRESAADFSSRIAVQDGSVEFTYAEWYERVDRLSQGLLSLGLQKGDVLLAWLPNSYRALETELACLQIGAIWVTLNAGLTWPEVEIVVESTNPVIMVTERDLYARIPAKERTPQSKTDTMQHLVATDAGTVPEVASFVDYETLLTASQSQRPDIAVAETDTARLRYTSGTTGKAKAAVLQHRAYLASLRNLQEQLHTLTPEDRVLHAAPLTHASAALAYPLLAAGGCNVILPNFDVETVLETIEKERITTMFAVPTMLQRMAASPSFRCRDLSSLRTISYGGAPMPVDALEEVVEVVGTALLQIYGLTEALHPVTSLCHEEHRVGNEKLGSVGKPTSINRVRLATSGGETIHAPDVVGEILVQGPNTMCAYWQDEEETKKTIVDGWVATGDLAYRDGDGYYWIVDRKKDVIISGGFNVYTAEVEHVLAAHSTVAEAAVVGIANEEWGESVHGMVSLHHGENVEAKELVQWCRSQLAGYKTPKAIWVQHHPLPKNSAGKILKSAVRELILKTKLE